MERGLNPGLGQPWPSCLSAVEARVEVATALEPERAAAEAAAAGLPSGYIHMLVCRHP